MAVKIMGVDWPMAYTVEAQKKIEEHFGGRISKEKIDEIFDTTDVAQLNDNIAFMAAVMFNAGKRREAVRKLMLGHKCQPMPEISHKQLKEIIQPGEMPMLMREIIRALNRGNKITVETKPPEKKRK